MSRIGVFLLAISLVLPAFAQEAQAPGVAQQPSTTRNKLEPSPVLNLADVLREALEKNPAIQSASHAVEAQRHRVPQAKSLPDPEASVGWMGNLTPFSVQEGDPSSYRGIGVMQSLPYPGKLKLRGEVAGQDVQMAQWEYEAVRRRVTADVKAAYYEYFFYDKALEITRRNKDLLQKLSSISQARYRVGKAMQQDVLKSQVEISLLLQKITVLEQQRATAQARLNSLMVRTVGSPFPPAANVELAALPESLDSLDAAALHQDPGLQREMASVRRSQLSTDLARKDYRPDFSIAYMFEQRPLMPDMNGMTFTMNVPVFYKTKQREQVRQAQEEVISAERSRDNRANDLQFELKQQYLAAQAAKQLLDLYTKAVVPQASLALESSMSAYEVGNVDFLTMLANFTTVLDYEVDYYRELSDYQTALARMEPLVGMDLTSAPPTDSSPTAAKQKE
jgi:outer membrane protein, heavy metal efflux system